MLSEKQIDYIAEAINEAFGQRCLEYAEGCACCEAWAQYDALTAAEQAEPAPSGYYYPIPMPLDADGNGPASFEEGEVRKLVFEVWDQDFHSHGSFDNLPEAIAYANRLNAPAARSGAVKVLQWGNLRPTEDDSLATDAYTSIGHYIASHSGWFLVGQSGWNKAGSLSEAQAAAQADYENRILAALEPAEPTVEDKTDVEPVAWGEDIGGKIVSVRMDKSRHCTVPLYTRPPESRLREALEKIANGSYDGLEVTPLPAWKMREIAKDALAQEDGR